MIRQPIKLKLYDSRAYFKDEAFCNSKMFQVPFHFSDALWAVCLFDWMPPKSLIGESGLGTWAEPGQTGVFNFIGKQVLSVSAKNWGWEVTFIRKKQRVAFFCRISSCISDVYYPVLWIIQGFGSLLSSVALPFHVALSFPLENRQGKRHELKFRLIILLLMSSSTKGQGFPAPRGPGGSLSY